MATTNPKILYGNMGDTSSYLTPGERNELQQQIAATQPTAPAPKKKVSLLDILSGAGTVVGSLLGAKQATRQQLTGGAVAPGVYNPYYYQQPPEQKKDNTMLIILAVVAVIVVVIVIVIASKNKKQ